MSNKFYITMAIPYATQKPHIGNSYEGVLTDSIARYQKLIGKDVFFLTGMDCHGKKVEQEAAAAGINPIEYTEKICTYTEFIWDLLDVKYDKMIRTTDEYHVEAVKKIFQHLYDNDDIYKSIYTGWYCVPDESFYTETQLIDGKCPDCGRDVEKANEESYFLKLSKYQKELEDHLIKYPDFVVPHTRKNEMVNNFIKPGLQDLAVTRTSFKWGIQVPFDENHVIYVWIDALANYITALGYTPDDINAELFKNLWPADLHVLGKDVLRFHMIYWPIMLMGLGIPLPKQILAHPWLLVADDDTDESQKMGKSRGNVIYAEDLVKYIGTDATRYYVLSSIPFGNDSAISFKDMIVKYNADLANTLGNLVNRTISMQQKYFDGVIQKKVDVNDEFDNKLYATRDNTISKYKNAMDEYHISEAIKHVMDLARASNKYIDETTPWILAKDEKDKERLGSVLYNLLENIRTLAVLLTPFIPTTAKEILRQINVKDEFSDIASLGNTDIIKAFDEVNLPIPIFERLDEKKKLEEIHEHQADLNKTEETIKEPIDEETNIITIDDFTKVKLIAAEIVNCEPIEGAKKLLKLQLDDGTKILRQVVSAIADSYTKEDLIGKKIALVKNLKPIKLRGEISNGMILAASVSEDVISVLFLDSNVPNGAMIN